jgi:transposase
MGRYLLEVTRNNATTLPEGYTQHAKEVAERIKALDSSISRPAAERYPETIYLQQVSGVGPITSLYFVLKVGNPGRFQRTRHWSLPGLVSEAGSKRRD